MNKKKLSHILSNVPYSERIILLPQCLRSNQCKAPRKKFGILECQECFQKRDDHEKCPIPIMVSIAREIGYLDVYIFSGGSGIVPLLEEKGLPKAVLGIACKSEIREGKEKMDNLGIPTQTKCLLEDGCAETILFEENLEKEWIKVLTEFPPKRLR